MSIAAGLLGVAGALGAAGLSYATTQMANKKQLQYQKDFFDYTNEYNLPFQQRERLIQAGYNPNLALSGVNSTAGASMPSVGAAPRYQFDKDIFGLQLGAQLRQMEAQTELIKSQDYHQVLLNKQLEAESPYWDVNAQVKSDTLHWLRDSKKFSSLDAEINHTLNEMIARSKLGLDADVIGRDGGWLDGEYFKLSDTPLASYVVNDMLSKGYSNDVAQKRIQVMDKQIDEMMERIELMKKQGSNIDMRTELLGLEKDMKNSLGVTFNDGLGWRILAEIMVALGVDLKSLYKHKTEDQVPEGAGYSGVSQHGYYE